MLKVYPKKESYSPLLKHITTKPTIPDWYKKQKTRKDNNVWDKFANRTPAKSNKVTLYSKPSLIQTTLFNVGIILTY